MAQNTPEAFLAEPNVAILASVDRRGRPHATPVWYLYENGELLVSVGKGSQKHRNVEANPDVTLVVDRRTLPYYVVMVHGRVELGPRFPEADRLRLATRYIGEERARAYIAATQNDESVTLRIRPRKIVEYHGRAGRPDKP